MTRFFFAFPNNYKQSISDCLPSGTCHMGFLSCSTHRNFILKKNF